MYAFCLNSKNKAIDIQIDAHRVEQKKKQKKPKTKDGGIRFVFLFDTVRFERERAFTFDMLVENN